MNKTCNMPKHTRLWSIETLVSFAPTYPTSIRGTSDNQPDDPGTR